MAVATPALLDLNLTKVTGVVRTVSSAEAAMPSRFLDDQARGKVWRSKLGHNVVAGVNDKLDFEIYPGPTVLAATLTPGNYASPADFAVMVAARMNAVDPQWTVTYSAGTKFFSLTPSTQLTIFLTATGTNLATSAYKDLGITVADPSSSIGVATVSDIQVTHSREWVAYDFGSATAITAAIAYEHNLGSGSGTIQVRSSATSVIAALTAPTVTQNLTGDTTLVYKLFASQSHRYVAFFIDDVGSVDGFSEMAISYLGTYRSPKCYSASLQQPRSSLSELTFATEGALAGDQRPQQRAWGLMWKNLESTDTALFEAFYTATPEGKCYFLFLDTAGGSTKLIYGFHGGAGTDVSIDTETGGLVYGTQFVFREALP